MAKRPEPPEFGNWESGGEYTEYFENKNKGRSGGKRKPNDPKETNSNSPQSEERKVHHGNVGPRTSKGPPDTLKSSLEERPSREEGEVMRIGNDAVGRKAATVDSPHHNRHGGISSSTVDGSKRSTRTSVGSDRSIEQLPLHPHQPRAVNRGGGVSSPSWERKGGSAESGHGVPPPTTPGRSRLRSTVTREDETPDDGGPTVPKFGDWDESDPASAEGFTQVFERVRDEKNNAGKSPLTPTSSSNGLRRRGGNETSKNCFCFPWGRK